MCQACHHGYIQNTSGEELLDDTALDEHLGDLVTALGAFGADGERAAQATREIHSLIVSKRARIAAMKAEIDRAVMPLPNVWKQLDFLGSKDVGEEDVLMALDRFNSAAATAGNTLSSDPQP